MIENIEFYTSPDGAVYVKPLNKAVYLYDVEQKQITAELVAKIRDLYPGAFEALAQLYSKSTRNRGYYEYQIVHRFIRCNLGEYDTLQQDIDGLGYINLEEVRCPLRGECRHEGIICKPVLKSQLTPRETEVAELLATGLRCKEVADELDISVYTVNRHIANIKARMHFKNLQQIIVHFNSRK